MLSKFIKKVSEADTEEYVCVREFVGDAFLENLFSDLIRKNPNVKHSEQAVDYFMEVTSHIYMKFPETKPEDLISVDPKENFQSPEKVAEQIQNEILGRMDEELMNKLDDEFPVFVDIFDMNGVVFAYEIVEKERALSNLMDRFVNQERYEKAAKVRDALEEIGSDKIK